MPSRNTPKKNTQQTKFKANWQGNFPEEKEEANKSESSFSQVYGHKKITNITTVTW